MGPSNSSDARRSAGWALVAAVVAAVILCVVGVRWMLGGAILPGLVLIASTALILTLGAMLFTAVSLLAKNSSTTLRSYDALLDLLEQNRRQTDSSRTIADNTSLSDWAKKIVYREKDYEYLRDTIHGLIVRQDWAAAEHLIKDLDEEFGYVDEAELFREELAKARRATEEERVVAALARFDKLCAEQKWEQAQGEVQRLKALFAHEERITRLPEVIESRRLEYKRMLLKEYDQAVRAHDVDRAHRLLYRLDAYLSPNEGAALKDSARGVFKAKLQQMGVEFSLAVSDRKFASAIDVGQRLMREFPNSRYAHEIANMLPVLRQRASAEAGQNGNPALV